MSVTSVNNTSFFGSIAQNVKQNVAQMSTEEKVGFVAAETLLAGTVVISSLIAAGVLPSLGFIALPISGGILAGLSVLVGLAALTYLMRTPAAPAPATELTTFKEKLMQKGKEALQTAKEGAIAAANKVRQNPGKTVAAALTIAAAAHTGRRFKESLAMVNKNPNAPRMARLKLATQLTGFQLGSDLLDVSAFSVDTGIRAKDAVVSAASAVKTSATNAATRTGNAIASAANATGNRVTSSVNSVRSAVSSVASNISARVEARQAARA